MPTDDLLAYLFDGRPHLLAQPMATWIASSRRFATFATTFQDKIRKKIRTTPEHENLLDLQLELETAFLLLRERSLSVAYEPEMAKGIRSPDFAVSFTTSHTFMLEVTRIQADAKSTPEARLAAAIAEKLGQLLPQRSNALLVGIEATELNLDDIQRALLGIQQRAEQNDQVFLRRHRFRDRADFFRHYQRLSEILVRQPQLDAGNSVVTWINPQAKHPLPSKVRNALYRSHVS
ncbi:MAG: hypothetical protein M9936_27090 [Caldilinea sp.]|nr:hypothetical protein [Caldilinea sp.]MCO5213384.1 hypothetical protein [Caldilinea sp.]MCW5844904.1 hypothetical protein [Caldilinea sp.]